MNTLYQEIIQNLESQLNPKELNTIKQRQLHLGIFTEPYLSYILDGRKIIESRFSKNKIAPYGKISIDDIVFLKKSGGEIIGYFTIKEVLSFNLNVTPITEIKKTYGASLCVDDFFWKQKENSRYATLLVIDSIIPLNPFPIHKKGMQTWIVIEKS